MHEILIHLLGKWLQYCHNYLFSIESETSETQSFEDFVVSTNSFEPPQNSTQALLSTQIEHQIYVQCSQNSWLKLHCLKITLGVAFECLTFCILFIPMFVQLKLTCQVTLFNHTFSSFQNVNVARFARNVKLSNTVMKRHLDI